MLSSRGPRWRDEVCPLARRTIRSRATSLSDLDYIVGPRRQSGTSGPRDTSHPATTAIPSNALSKHSLTANVSDFDHTVALGDSPLSRAPSLSDPDQTFGQFRRSRHPWAGSTTLSAPAPTIRRRRTFAQANVWRPARRPLSNFRPPTRLVSSSLACRRGPSPAASVPVKDHCHHATRDRSHQRHRPHHQ